MSQATEKFTAILTDNIATADYQQPWPNTLRADAAIVFLRDFYLSNSTENGEKYLLGGSIFDKVTWNDSFHVRQQGEQTLEAQYIQMFGELCAFLMAQPSDDLILMTLQTGIRRYQLFKATNIVDVTQFGPIASRLFPLMKNW